MSDPSLPDLFARALELDPTARQQLLTALRERDAEQARRLGELLERHERTSSPIDESPWQHLRDEVEDQVLPPEIAGYRILRELGRGGMGRVFLAEKPGDPARQRVALKVIARSARGADAVRRFRDEVRILASLEHPGVARFLDGGQAPDGTLYLALEYVEGEDLRTYAERRSLPITARLELFRAALDAVGHAHERGVVHRDLKPNHLLVGADGRPRLLDFGISKLLEAGAESAAVLTTTGGRALTPAYAAPEQFRGEPVTPASDVYALGVVLYELVTGRRPFAELGTGPALERAVLESDPEPPSRTARRMATAATPEAIGDWGSRGAGVDRDLDAICLKALRKLPAERYRDAGAFAADLERYLAGRPVAARRGGLRYRLVRAAQRSRTTVVTAVTVAALAALATWIVSRPGTVAKPPEPRPFPYTSIDKVPLEELRRHWAEEPASPEAGGALVLGLLHARRLDEAALILARLRQIPGEEENPLTDYVAGLLAAAQAEPQRALILYTQALSRAIAAGRGDLVPRIRTVRGRLLTQSGQREEGTREQELAVRELEQAGDHAALSGALNDLAIESLQSGDAERGERLLRRAVEEGRLGGVSVRLPLLNLGIHQTMGGRPDLAVEPLEALVESQREEGHAGNLGQALGVLAHVYHDLGRADDAERAYAEGVERLQAGGNPRALRSALEARTLMDIDIGNLDRATETIAELEGRAGEEGDFNARAWVSRLRALVAAAQGDLAAMRSESERARRLLVENDDPDQAAEVDAAEALAELRAGDPARARAAAAQARARLPPGDLTSEPAVIATIVLARLDAEAGDLETATTAISAFAEAAQSPSLARRIQSLSARAALARARGEVDSARADLDVALAAARAARRSGDVRQLERALGALDAGGG